MAALPLPTKTDGTQRYTMRIVLDGSTFLLEFAWNARDASWYIQVSDANANLLLVRRIAVGTGLLRRFQTLSLPRGELLAIDTSGKDIDPGLADLGDRVQLLYIPAADVP
jgi:hypothetical protein